MGRFIDKSHIAPTGAQPYAFLHWTKLFNRESLKLGGFDRGLVAENTERILAGGEPIMSLSLVSEEGDVHFAEEPVDKVGAQLRDVVVKPDRYPARPGGPDIAGGYFSFQLRPDKIP